MSKQNENEVEKNVWMERKVQDENKIKKKIK